MKKSISFPFILIMVFLTNVIYAGNYAEKECVRSYNTMVKYSNKARLNAKSKSIHSMNVNYKMAKSYAAEAIVDCNGVRDDLHYKAQNIFDEFVAIDDTSRQLKEEARIQADLEKEIAEAEAEAAEEMN